jgi:hypothetical protein
VTEFVERLAKEALDSLSHAWIDGGKNLVSLPVQYPSGGMVTIEVSAGKHHVHLSDMGMGLWEAQQLCSESSFHKFAEAEARRRGIKFDGHAVLALDLPLASLAAGLLAVANASAHAAAAAVLTDATKKDEARKDAVFNRVRLAFPSFHVHKALHIQGSRAEWDVHNVVDLSDNRKIVFEPVSNHAGSVSAKFLMFSDLGNRKELSLQAVFSNPHELDPKSQMIRDVARVIGESDDLEIYKMAAA